MEKRGRSLDNQAIHFHVLTEELAQEKLRQALTSSGGNAAMIIHPYHPTWRMHRMGETNPQIKRRLIPQWYWNITREDPSTYARYRKRLRLAARRYQNLQLPIILFQAEDSHANVRPTLRELGLSSTSNVFVITTKSHDPMPRNETLPQFIKRLQTLGLQKTLVAGSYLYREPSKTHIVASDKKNPPIKRGFALAGCVGSVVDALLQENIYATGGFATYPKTSQQETS